MKVIDNNNGEVYDLTEPCLTKIGGRYGYLAIANNQVYFITPLDACEMETELLENFEILKTDKPHFNVSIRISIDSAHNTRFTADEIKSLIEKNEAELKGTLIIRKKDGAVLGQIIF